MASTSDEGSFAALLSELTLEEKITLLSGNTFNTTPGIPRLGIPQIKVADSINGIRPTSLDSDMTTACFPSTTCLASTWDAELLGRMGEQLAHEARLKSAQVVLGPTINIHRDPRGGRNFECFSEDPLLSGQLGGAIVNGIQKHGVGACPKHFVCNDSETMRHYYNVTESPHGRTLREIYLAAWQHLLRVSDPVAIMTAYNKVDGSFCSENGTLLTKVLRKTFGYDGVTMSDWFGTHSTAASVKAGLDLEMPFPLFRAGKLVKEVTLGTVAEAEIDQCALKMLQLRDRTKTCHGDADERSEINEETNKVARELAAGGLVLLKNEDNTLPLNTSQPIKVAVIGEFANEPVVTGGGSASCKPQYKLKPLELLQQAFSEHGTVQYSPGVRTRRIIPVAPTTQLTAADGRNGVDISYFNDSNPSQPLLTEHQPSPHVFMIGQFKPGLDVPGSRLEITTTLTPLTTGTHTLAVRCTGPFTLTVNNTPILSRSTQPSITTEQALFNPTRFQTTTTVPMTAHQPYTLHLTMQSPRAAERTGEPTVYAATLAFEEEYSEAAAIAAAAALAQQSDVSVVFCGRSDQYESEGFDLEDVAMPENQTRMIQAVAAAAGGGRTVLVLQGGNPIDVGAVVEGVQAVVLAHFLGQEGARAVVDVLCGRVNPSGRLATTWWKGLEEAPSFGHFPAVVEGGEGGGINIRYAEGLGVGYRCEGLAGRARWPFGFGLSYTEFAYDELRVTADDGSLRCAVGVMNVGQREGREVVQLYVRGRKSAAVWRPERELKAFTKISLQPGERKVVELDADLKIACSYWDERGHTWRLEEGEYEVEVGHLVGRFTVTRTVEWNHV